MQIRVDLRRIQSNCVKVSERGDYMKKWIQFSLKVEKMSLTYRKRLSNVPTVY